VEQMHALIETMADLDEASVQFKQYKENTKSGNGCQFYLYAK
jgi:hypothetical protein